ncbi:MULTISPECIES: site-specific integrase [unclassified Rhizobium]|uniref:site-specific integrase n=1 Tax=unclassified Rhizobium TaxID=2613769 RepID=UPI001AE992F4|nr:MULTISPECIES: site-specific integrase [unclassified Rhizobium]MBP2460512.1 integrase [Rhizobium sp. PvP014]MBP2527909.1 integrase [Rhizobium sp. PvP099]
MINTSDMLIKRADADFTWDGEKLPGLPILHWPDGTLCEPVIRVFAYRASNTRKMISSFATEIYAIREWLVYLLNRRVDWDSPSDGLMSEWVSSQSDRAGEARTSYKVNSVFDFYYYARFAIQFRSNGERMPYFTNDPFVAPGSRDFPISADIRVRKKMPPVACWSRRITVSASNRKKPAPSDKTVELLFGSIRNKVSVAGRKFGKPPYQDDVTRLVAIRNWMIARCEAGAMLRAMEVSGLAVSDFNEALISTSLLPLDREGLSKDIDVRCLDYQSQNYLLDKIDELENRGRENVFVTVHGKGSKSRKAPFPIPLFRDILQYIIWDVRYVQVSNWRNYIPDYAESENVFLSFETRDGLSGRSIANLIKTEANAAGVAVSGHLLRHYGATKDAKQVWDEELRKSDYVLTSHTSSNVGDRLADRLGHSSNSTAGRFYVDFGQLEAHSEANLRSVNGYRRTMELLRRKRTSLSEDDFATIFDIVTAVANQGPGSAFHQLLGMALADSNINPPPIRPPRNERRRLRIVK